MYTICYFLGTYEDWGGASRALLNFVKSVDRTRFRPVVVLTRSGNLCKKLEEDNIDYRIRDIHDSSKNIFSYIAQVIDSVRFFKREKIDLVHINYGQIGWKPAEIIAAKLLGIPILNHFHSTIKAPSPFLKLSSAIIGVSNAILDRSECFDIPTHTVYNIADFKRFSSGNNVRDELGVPENSVIVSFIGQVKKIKGICQFIELAKEFDRPNVCFLIAGEVKESTNEFNEDMFHQMIKDEDRIKYIGYRRDIENVYMTSDIIVMPSYYEEPCAMILFESAAAAKPLVATNTGGTPEVIKDGETGFLYDKDDIDTLYLHVEKLIEDADLRESIGANAKHRVNAMFTSKQVDRLENIYLDYLVSD